ncbi:DUF642 domain-containing protein [Pseudoalteromonas gelatinilytica]
MKKLISKLAILPLAIASTFAMSNTNLVENGSFEADKISERSGTWQLYNELTNWSSSENAYFEVQTNLLGEMTAQDGDQYLELNSTKNYRASQKIATTPGETYEFSLYYSARINGAQGTNNIEVYWNGKLLEALNSSQKGWTKYTYTIEATGTTSEIAIAGTGVANGYGGIVDNISVVQVSNPATNLVQNGSFEADRVTAADGRYQFFEDVAYWTANENQWLELQASSLNKIDAQDGEQYLELNSYENYSASQEIPTQAGKQYELSFYYAGRVENQEGINSAEVFWNGELLEALDTTQIAWTKHSYTVDGTDVSSLITLKGTGSSAGQGGFIDNVVVTEIAEPCAVTTGLYGINNFGSETEGYVYHFNPESGAVSIVAGLNNTASNIASKDGVLYFMEQLDKSSKASKIHSLDLATDTQAEVADATSFPIYRSTVTADGLSLRTTSKTYMYDFDLSTGEKTVLGKLSYDGDTFSDGDIAYSSDYNVLYVLTGKALYTLDEGSLELTQIGEHGINWASGLAISDDGTIYVSGRENGENAKIYTLDQNTAAATFVMDGPAHVNDLTFVSEAVCEQ